MASVGDAGQNVESEILGLSTALPLHILTALMVSDKVFKFLSKHITKGHNVDNTAAAARSNEATESSPGATAHRRYPQAVRTWLIAGLVLIFVQVIVGGITRLTGSGLSITKWEIVTGTLPPLNETAWAAEFELYKATPQYEKLNDGMPLADFKFIYFWEYFHRLWARMMGLVFVVPLGYFLLKGWIDRRLAKRLALVFVAAALTASFGWIMVASGLIERPLVNAYKLSMHLAIAFVTFGILLWTTFWTYNVRLSMPTQVRTGRQAKPSSRIRALVLWTAGVLVVQILLGGMMSGMKAALVYPTWPDLSGQVIPEVLLSSSNWSWMNVVEYERSPFMSALVQVLHRTTAYILAALIVGLAYFSFRQNQWQHARRWRTAVGITLALMLVQVFLGIITVVLSKGTIPVSWGVLHQAGALLLLAAVLWDVWLVRSVEGMR